MNSAILSSGIAETRVAPTAERAVFRRAFPPSSDMTSLARATASSIVGTVSGSGESSSGSSVGSCSSGSSVGSSTLGQSVFSSSRTIAAMNSRSASSSETPAPSSQLICIISAPFLFSYQVSSASTWSTMSSATLREVLSGLEYTTLSQGYSASAVVSTSRSYESV